MTENKWIYPYKKKKNIKKRGKLGKTGPKTQHIVSTP